MANEKLFVNMTFLSNIASFGKDVNTVLSNIPNATIDVDTSKALKAIDELSTRAKNISTSVASEITKVNRGIANVNGQITKATNKLYKSVEPALMKSDLAAQLRAKGLEGAALGNKLREEFEKAISRPTAKKLAWHNAGPELAMFGKEAQKLFKDLGLVDDALENVNAEVYEQLKAVGTLRLKISEYSGDVVTLSKGSDTLAKHYRQLAKAQESLNRAQAEGINSVTKATTFIETVESKSINRRLASLRKFKEEQRRLASTDPGSANLGALTKRYADEEKFIAKQQKLFARAAAAGTTGMNITQTRAYTRSLDALAREIHKGIDSDLPRIMAAAGRKITDVKGREMQLKTWEHIQALNDASAKVSSNRSADNLAALALARKAVAADRSFAKRTFSKLDISNPDQQALATVLQTLMQSAGTHIHAADAARRGAEYEASKSMMVTIPSAYKQKLFKTFDQELTNQARRKDRLAAPVYTMQPRLVEGSTNKYIPEDITIPGYRSKRAGTAARALAEIKDQRGYIEHLINNNADQDVIQAEMNKYQLMRGGLAKRMSEMSTMATSRFNYANDTRQEARDLHAKLTREYESGDTYTSILNNKNLVARGAMAAYETHAAAVANVNSILADPGILKKMSQVDVATLKSQLSSIAFIRKQKDPIWASLQKDLPDANLLAALGIDIGERQRLLRRPSFSQRLLSSFGFSPGGAYNRENNTFIHGVNKRVTNMAQMAGTSLYGMGIFGLGTALATKTVGASAEKETLVNTLGGLINSYAKFTSVTGGAASAQENFSKSLAYAGKVYDMLREKAAKSILTTQEMFDYFMSGAPQLLSRGLNMQQVTKMVTAIATLGKSMGLSSTAVQSDIRDLAMGTVTVRSQVLRTMGMTSGQLRAARAKGPEGVEQYFDRVMKGMAPALARVESTTTSKIARFMNALQQLGIKFGDYIAPIFTRNIGKIQEAFEKWEEDGTLKKFADSFSKLITSILKIAEWFASHASWFDSVGKIATWTVGLGIGKAAGGSLMETMFQQMMPLKLHSPAVLLRAEGIKAAAAKSALAAGEVAANGAAGALGASVAGKESAGLMKTLGGAGKAFIATLVGAGAGLGSVFKQIAEHGLAVIKEFGLLAIAIYAAAKVAMTLVKYGSSNAMNNELVEQYGDELKGLLKGEGLSQEQLLAGEKRAIGMHITMGEKGRAQFANPSGDAYGNLYSLYTHYVEDAGNTNAWRSYAELGRGMVNKPFFADESVVPLEEGIKTYKESEYVSRGTLINSARKYLVEHFTNLKDNKRAAHFANASINEITDVLTNNQELNTGYGKFADKQLAFVNAHPDLFKGPKFGQGIDAALTATLATTKQSLAIAKLTEAVSKFESAAYRAERQINLMADSAEKGGVFLKARAMHDKAAAEAGAARAQLGISEQRAAWTLNPLNPDASDTDRLNAAMELQQAQAQQVLAVNKIRDAYIDQLRQLRENIITQKESIEIQKKQNLVSLMQLDANSKLAYAEKLDYSKTTDYSKFRDAFVKGLDKQSKSIDIAFAINAQSTKDKLGAITRKADGDKTVLGYFKGIGGVAGISPATISAKMSELVVQAFGHASDVINGYAKSQAGSGDKLIQSQNSLAGAIDKNTTAVYALRASLSGEVSPDPRNSGPLAKFTRSNVSNEVFSQDLRKYKTFNALPKYLQARVLKDASLAEFIEMKDKYKGTYVSPDTVIAGIMASHKGKLTSAEYQHYVLSYTFPYYTDAVPSPGAVAPAKAKPKSKPKSASTPSKATGKITGQPLPGSFPKVVSPYAPMPVDSSNIGYAGDQQSDALSAQSIVWSGAMERIGIINQATEMLSKYVGEVDTLATAQADKFMAITQTMAERATKMLEFGRPEDWAAKEAFLASNYWTDYSTGNAREYLSSKFGGPANSKFASVKLGVFASKVGGQLYSYGLGDGKFGFGFNPNAGSLEQQGVALKKFSATQELLNRINHQTSSTDANNALRAFMLQALDEEMPGATLGLSSEDARNAILGWNKPNSDPEMDKRVNTFVKSIKPRTVEWEKEMAGKVAAMHSAIERATIESAFKSTFPGQISTAGEFGFNKTYNQLSRESQQVLERIGVYGPQLHSLLAVQPIDAKIAEMDARKDKVLPEAMQAFYKSGDAKKLMSIIPAVSPIAQMVLGSVLKAKAEAAGSKAGTSYARDYHNLQVLKKITEEFFRDKETRNELQSANSLARVENYYNRRNDVLSRRLNFVQAGGAMMSPLDLYGESYDRQKQDIDISVNEQVNAEHMRLLRTKAGKRILAENPHYLEAYRARLAGEATAALLRRQLGGMPGVLGRNRAFQSMQTLGGSVLTSPYAYISGQKNFGEAIGDVLSPYTSMHQTGVTNAALGMLGLITGDAAGILKSNPELGHLVLGVGPLGGFLPTWQLSKGRAWSKFGADLGGNIGGNVIGNMFGNALFPGKSPEAIGAGTNMGVALGGMLAKQMFGHALGAFTGPAGMIAGGIIGSLFGGIFGGSRPDPEAERQRQLQEQHQKKLEELLSKIDRSLRPLPDYMKTIRGEIKFGSATSYFAGRAYAAVGRQSVVGSR